jgi:hypothetical protein
MLDEKNKKKRNMLEDEEDLEAIRAHERFEAAKLRKKNNDDSFDHDIPKYGSKGTR